MKSNKGFFVGLGLCLGLFICLIIGCGGAYSPTPIPSASTEPEIETGETAKLVLRINLGEENKERARGDLLPLIEESQWKKVSRISGCIENQTKCYHFDCDTRNECSIELEVVPGIYHLYIGAYQEYEQERETFSFNTFSYSDDIKISEGVNEKTVVLELENWQPIVITLPKDISVEPDKNRCFSVNGDNFGSCFSPLNSSTLVGIIPLDLGATEINLRLNDKIYQIEPQKFLDSLVFDEPVALTDCQWIPVTIAILDVGVSANKVVAGTTGLTVLKFQATEDFNVDVLRIAKNGSNEEDIKEVTLIGGETVIGKSTISHGHAHFYFLNSPLVIAKGTVFTLLADIATSAGNENEFSFEIGAINDNPDFCPIKQVGPEFTIIQQGNVSTKVWCPDSSIVLAGSTGNYFMDVELSAKGEDARIESLVVQVEDGGYCGDVVGEYKDVSEVSIYDRNTLLAKGNIPFGGLTFYLTNLIIPKGSSKTLTVKADMATVDPDTDNAPGTNSADVKIAISDIKAIGMISNALVSVSGPPIESSAMILRTSRPIVEYSSQWNPLGATTALTNGNICLFAFKITADAAGKNVLLHKISLNFMSSEGIEINDIRIMDENGYILNYGSFNCKDQNCSMGYTLNNPDFDTSKEESIEIPSGQSRIFKVYATVTGVSTGKNISIALIGDNACSPVDTARNIQMENFVWSDNYRQAVLNDAPALSQWYNGHLVPNLWNPVPYVISTF